MKAMKQMMALILTIIMTMTMAVTAFAAENAGAPKGTLTVKVNQNNTLEGQTIKLYKLLDLTVNADGAHAYKVNAAYKDILANVLEITKTNPTDSDFYDAINALSGTDANDTVRIQEFANDFTTALLSAPSVPDETEASRGPLGKDVTSYVFDNLDYGYYLVYQTGTESLQSSLICLDSAEKEVDLKGEAPSITKTANKETVAIGDIVTYTITGTIPDTTGYVNRYQYIIHDTLSDGLTFVADAKGTEFNATNQKVVVEITGVSSDTLDITLSEDKKTMNLDLSNWVRSKILSKGQTFTVTYYAKVNSKAVVQTENSATLEYGHNQGETITTTPVKVVTPTYPLDINKTNTPKTGENAKMLAGATFRLYKEQTNANSANDNAIKVTGSNGSYKVDPAAGATNMDMETIATAVGTGYNLRLNGLAAGDYWLVEIDAPDGYNKLAAPVKVTIAQDTTTDPAVKTNWTVSKDNTLVNDKIIDIQNSTGTVLPSTGGLGTMILTVIAIALMLGVAVSFIISRRRTE